MENQETSNVLPPELLHTESKGRSTGSFDSNDSTHGANTSTHSKDSN